MSIMASQMYKIIAIRSLNDLNDLEFLDEQAIEEKWIVFDMTMLNIVNSTFISFVNFHDSKVIALFNPTPRALNILTALGIHKLVNIVYSYAEVDALIAKKVAVVQSS